MPINFVTGLPRAGKTLWTLSHVKELAERENRQVYTCNIPGITLDGWKEIDHPDKWLDLDDSAIIVVDELQDFWGKNSPGQKVPLPILELSKHGKRGFDFFFITQEPNLVHTTPRDLCAHHYYVVRAFGMQKAIIYKFARMQTRPHTATRQAGVEKYPWAYPKKAFGWYKSADVHNIKRQIPLKLIAIPFLLLFAGGMIYTSYKLLTGLTDKAKSTPGQNPAQTASAAGVQGSPGLTSARPNKPQPMTQQEYLQAHVPRIPDMPQTAPVYDEITRPVQAPYPAACISSKSKGCKCYTQQGTILPTSTEVCFQIVENGFFVSWQQPGQPAHQPMQSAPPVVKPESVPIFAKPNDPASIS